MRKIAAEKLTNTKIAHYRGETYVVRECGEICRQSRPGEKKRPWDGRWTRGRQCRNHGYMRFNGLMVHQIVATAFHGPQPTPNHVVDHRDTDRANNNPENLRWVTRLENIHENPTTLKRIEEKWGSVEEMLSDSNKDTERKPWTDKPWALQALELVEYSLDTESLTPLAIQRSWKTPNAFPLCPEELSAQPLDDYLEELKSDSVFSHNRFGENLVERAAMNFERTQISVITRIIDGVKGWGLAKITVEEGVFVHEAHGTFFTYEGAEKKHCELIGIEWEAGDTFDDFC